MPTVATGRPLCSATNRRYRGPAPARIGRHTIASSASSSGIVGPASKAWRESSTLGPVSDGLHPWAGWSRRFPKPMKRRRHRRHLLLEAEPVVEEAVSQIERSGRRRHLSHIQEIGQRPRPKTRVRRLLDQLVELCLGESLAPTRGLGQPCRWPRSWTPGGARPEESLDSAQAPPMTFAPVFARDDLAT